MILQTPYSRNTSEGKQLWNPSKTLGIINTDPGYQGITCIGYAPSQGRRCRNPIRQDNRALIMDTLDDISYLSPDSPAVMSRLPEIVKPALCVRYHQGQAETVLLQWQKKLRDLQVPKVEEWRHGGDRREKTSRDRKSWKNEFQDALEELRKTKECLAELQEEVRRCRQRELDRDEKEPVQTEEEETEEENEEEELEREREWRRKERKRREEEQLEREQRRQDEERRREREERRKEKDRQEEERSERKRREKEELEKEQKCRERQQAAYNERIRQRAQKVREEREIARIEKEKKEREEWEELWAKYQERWTCFKTSASSERSLREAIPWPVKSDSYRDVNASRVSEFFDKAIPKDADMVKLLRKECRKWHPDMICRLPRASELTESDRMMADKICRVVTELLNCSAGRSAEFFD